VISQETLVLLCVCCNVKCKIWHNPEIFRPRHQMHSYLYDIQKLETQFGCAVPENVDDLPDSLIKNDCMRLYYKYLIDDINRRKAEVMNSKKSKKRKIREHNAPRGVEFEPTERVYKSDVAVGDQVLPIPPSHDPDEVVRRRALVEKYIQENSGPNVGSIENQNMLTQIKNLLQSFPVPHSMSAVAEVDTSLQTPMKPISATVTNPGTPMTVPHRVMGQPDIDVLKFRDKYYCRFLVFSEYISTPMRRTRQEAENDLKRVKAKLGEIDSIIKNPLTKSSGSHMDRILDEMKTFSNTLDGTPSVLNSPVASPREPQTESKNSRASLTLPSGIYRLRDLFYTTVSLYGEVVSTPARNTVDQVMEDRQFFMSEAAKRAELAEKDKAKAIEEIARALRLHDEVRTPRKSM
jgi:hypothetical protein